MSLLNTAIYSGLINNRTIPYPGPDGQETHFYFGAQSPASGPETGLITLFQQPQTGYVYVVDKFNASILSSDTSQNQILVQYFSADYSVLYWQFALQMGLLIGNPQYSYPTFLANVNWNMALSFVANSGSFPTEYFSFRQRLININGAD